MKNYKEKTIEELNKINTKNLLAYYKSCRLRFFRFRNTKVCDCCHEIVGDKDFIKDAEREIKLRNNYLDLIKTVLSKREHVSIKK